LSALGDRTGSIVEQEILSLDGLVLFASCNAAGEVTLLGRTTVNNSHLSAWTVNGADGMASTTAAHDLDVGETVTVPLAAGADHADQIGEGRSSQATRVGSSTSPTTRKRRSARLTAC